MATFVERRPTVEAIRWDGTQATALLLKALVGVDTLAELKALYGSQTKLGDWVVKDPVMGGISIWPHADFVAKYEPAA
jgi:hypothetical protein